MNMEALPPNLRDFSLWARIAGSGASLWLAPTIPALSRRSSCFPAALYPPPRSAKPSPTRGTGKPDISFAI